MKILFVNHTSSLTGAPLSCFHLMKRLGHGFLPIYITKERGPILDWLMNANIKHYIVEERGFLGLKYIAAFRRIMRYEKINLIHLNTLTPFCKYAGIAGFLLKIPVIWVIRENPMISRSRRLRFWLKILSSKIVFVDRDTRDKLLPNKSSNVDIIYNGVDVDTFKPFKNTTLFETLNIEISKKLIGYIGLITRRKGLEYLIKAFSIIKGRYKDVKLIIIGGYKTNEENHFLEIKKIVEELNLESDTYFTGELPDIRHFLNCLDIVVLPSLEERCSRVLLESLASGKAVVATKVGGTPEIIDDGINGMLVEPRNERQIAEAVLKLLSDAELRKQMEVNGREKVEKYFDIRSTTRKMEELYINLSNHVNNPKTH